MNNMTNPTNDNDKTKAKAKYKTILFTLALSTTSLLATNSSLAHEKMPSADEENTLKSVMRGLLDDSQQISKGIVLADFSLILAGAKRVADHPTPGMATKMKLMAGMGSDMATFKKVDDVVHNTAVAMVKSAEQKDMPAVVKQYHKMIDGCVSCHTRFRAKVAKILAD